jgi:hypothetical protein
MPRKKQYHRERELAQSPPRFPSAIIRTCDLTGSTPTDAAPYIANEMRKHNATQDDINDFYTEVRRCRTLKEAVTIIKKYCRVYDR